MTHDAQSNTSDFLTPSELRWILSKIDKDEPRYDLLMRCLGSMNHLMSRLEYERRQRMALTARLGELDPPPAGSDAT